MRSVSPCLLPRARALMLALVLASVAAARDAHAERYACVTASGVRYVSDRPWSDCYALLLGSDLSAGRPAPRAVPTPAPRAPRGSGRILAKASPYGAIIADAALASGVDPYLLTAVIAVESGFDPSAVSPKGAVGLMQVVPATGIRYGVGAASSPEVVRQLTDPVINVRTGARYLGALLRRYPDNLTLALAAYNAGEGSVAKYGGTVPPYDETRAYVTRVLEHYRQLSAFPVPSDQRVPWTAEASAR